jgi:hypothetical protein
MRWQRTNGSPQVATPARIPPSGSSRSFPMNVNPQAETELNDAVTDTGFAHIPLNKLAISEQNIRRTDRKVFPGVQN